jgi:HEAT repeat protein
VTAPVKPSPTLPPENDTAAKLASGLAELPAADWPKYLARARDAKGGEFTRALVLLVHKVDGARKTDARTALAERLTRMTAETLRGMMTGDDAELRRAAVLAAAMKDDKAHVPDLIGRLTDDEDIVSRAASAGLKSLTGQDFGPPPGATRDDRKMAAEAWRQWWAKQK